GRAAVKAELEANHAAIQARHRSPRVNNPEVKAAVSEISAQLGQRKSPYPQRAVKQASHLKLPKFPTTTIGSFPQTAEIRQARSQFKAGKIDESRYREVMRAEIARSIREQQDLGLDVFVHGEAERNDMV